MASIRIPLHVAQAGRGTFEEDLIDLGWHQREFTLGFSFAQPVMSLDEPVCLGCVYFEPTSKANYDVAITMWMRESELASELDRRLFQTVKSWLASEWPFSNPASTQAATFRSRRGTRWPTSNSDALWTLIRSATKLPSGGIFPLAQKVASDFVTRMA